MTARRVPGPHALSGPPTFRCVPWFQALEKNLQAGFSALRQISISSFIDSQSQLASQLSRTYTQLNSTARAKLELVAGLDAQIKGFQGQVCAFLRAGASWPGHC